MKRFVRDLEAIAKTITARELGGEELVRELLAIVYAPIVAVDPTMQRAVVIPDNPAIRIRALEYCLLQHASRIGVLEPIDAEERAMLGLPGGIKDWALRLVDAAHERVRQMQQDALEQAAADDDSRGGGFHLN